MGRINDGDMGSTNDGSTNDNNDNDGFPMGTLW